MLILALGLACHDDVITRPVSCGETSLDDDTWFGTSLAAAQARFHAAPVADDADWNVENDVGADPERITLDPAEFTADVATVCTADGDLEQLWAPVTIAMSGEDWIPASEAEGKLVLQYDGQVWVQVEGAVPFPSGLRHVGASLIAEAMGVSVADEDVPDEAWLKAGTAGGDFYAELQFSADQTVVFADASGPEPMGAEVLLARTRR
jgi:hypothetical protein